MSENEKQWKCNFKLEIISKAGVSLEDFNSSLDKFVSDWIDVIPDTGTAAPESAIDFWHGGLHFPPDDKEQKLGKQNEKTKHTTTISVRGKPEPIWQEA